MIYSIHHGLRTIHHGLFVTHRGLLILLVASVWNGLFFTLGMMAGALIHLNIPDWAVQFSQ